MASFNFPHQKLVWYRYWIKNINNPHPPTYAFTTADSCFLPQDIFLHVCLQWNLGSLPLLPFALLSWGYLIFDNITNVTAHTHYSRIKFCLHHLTMFLFITVKLRWNNLYCVKSYINNGDFTVPGPWECQWRWPADAECPELLLEW